MEGRKRRTSAPEIQKEDLDRVGRRRVRSHGVAASSLEIATEPCDVVSCSSQIAGLEHSFFGGLVLSLLERERFR
ncbi:hypothetical protein HPP92_024869 [Vanilla planifolia]|uniref:Uncharacterized protein n=1 Tax=Vanilla planifolia TaxID=51239 RepID=A0A835PSY8_VANPL|nr:hypothetical protein HPP92_024869 [Vanilla planifolia]